MDITDAQIGRSRNGKRRSVVALQVDRIQLICKRYFHISGFRRDRDLTVIDDRRGGRSIRQLDGVFQRITLILCQADMISFSC